MSGEGNLAAMAPASGYEALLAIDAFVLEPLDGEVDQLDHVVLLGDAPVGRVGAADALDPRRRRERAHGGRLGGEVVGPAVAALEPMAGTLSVKKGDQSMTIIYVDTGFLPAEVTVSVFGGELEATVEKK